MFRIYVYALGGPINVVPYIAIRNIQSDRNIEPLQNQGPYVAYRLEEVSLHIRSREVIKHLVQVSTNSLDLCLFFFRLLSQPRSRQLSKQALSCSHLLRPKTQHLIANTHPYIRMTLVRKQNDNTTHDVPS